MDLELNAGALDESWGQFVECSSEPEPEPDEPEDYSSGDSSEPEDNTAETLEDEVDDGLGYDDGDED